MSALAFAEAAIVVVELDDGRLAVRVANDAVIGRRRRMSSFASLMTWRWARRCSSFSLASSAVCMSRRISGFASSSRARSSRSRACRAGRRCPPPSAPPWLPRPAWQGPAVCRPHSRSPASRPPSPRWSFPSDCSVHAVDLPPIPPCRRAKGADYDFFAAL